MSETKNSTEWGEWMGGWKAANERDDEADRLSRQKAAFGAETLTKLKELNILVIGCRGTGVESCKNLILSNVGGVTVWDRNPAEMRDLGANFYLTTEHVKSNTCRGDACLSQLKSLNPYCNVESHKAETLTNEFLKSKDINGTGKPFSAIIVTQLLPKEDMFRVNQIARENNIAFLCALTSGVTASIFSDFGPNHVITDTNGQAMPTKAISNIEVLTKPNVFKVSGAKDGDTIIVLTSDSQIINVSDGDKIKLDDFTGTLEPLSGKIFTAKRIQICKYDPKYQFDASINDTGEYTGKHKDPLLNNTMNTLSELLIKQYEEAKNNWEQGEEKKNQEFSIKKCRSITLLDRIVLVVDGDGFSPTEKEALLFASYQSGGLFTRQKPVVQKSYDSFKNSLVSTTSHNSFMGSETRFPQMIVEEDSLAGRGIEVHLQWYAALEFQQKHGRWPSRRSDKDAELMVQFVEQLSAANEKLNTDEKPTIFLQTNGPNAWDPKWEPRDVDVKRVTRFSKFFGAELTGLCAYLGGVVAQEVIKKTGKFTPIDQWLHHEDHALVTNDTPSNTGPPLNSRYDDQILILGKHFQNRAANARVFLVGCGALGCEYLKGMSLMGVGTGRRGLVTVTDMDIIETSNLSRQFLFRSSDVNKSKSLTGSRVVGEWNPTMNVNGIEKFVGPTTEDFFTDDFWESLDICWNALDNIKARQYTDGRCLWYSKPLLESGTTGTMTNAEVFLPFQTGSYNDGSGEEAPNVGIAMCTLKQFPYLPLHCIEFAKQAMYTENFEFGPTQYELYRKNKSDFFAALGDMGDDDERIAALKTVKAMVDIQKKEGKVSFDSCIRFAYQEMNTTFRDKIVDVITLGDIEEKEKKKDYWTGTKRRPSPIDFKSRGNIGAYTKEGTMCLEYLYASSNLYAHVFGLEPVRNRSLFSESVERLDNEGWQIVQTSADEGKNGGGEKQDNDIDSLKKLLQSINVSTLIEAKPHDFEKDDDSNFHIDYLTAATNLRAWNYNIKPSERHTVKVTAGNIIAALATTTAMVCGLVDLEFCKLILGLHNTGREKFLNVMNIDLAQGSEKFVLQAPSSSNIIKTGLKNSDFNSFTTWDKLSYDGNWTGSELANRLYEDFGVHVKSLMGETSYRPAKSVPLWSSDRGEHKEEEEQTLSEIFKQKLSAGGASKDRSTDNKKRVKNELKVLQSGSMEAIIDVTTKPSDDYCYQIQLRGPKGSSYEDGIFFIEVSLPHEYPNKPPKLSFVTPIKHCNILNGVPCPGLLYKGWGPASKVLGVLQTLELLLQEPSVEDALVPELASMKKEELDTMVRSHVKQHATPNQTFPVGSGSGSSGPKKGDLTEWHHNYLSIKGEFSQGELDEEGEEIPVMLPRIQLTFESENDVYRGGVLETAGNSEDFDKDTRVDSDDSEDSDDSDDASDVVDASSVALKFEKILDEDLQDAAVAKAAEPNEDDEVPVSDARMVYRLQPERAAIYAAAYPNSGILPSGENAICVFGLDDYEEQAEAVILLNEDGMPEKVIQSTDAIMMESCNLHAFPQFRFESDEPWRVCTGGAASIESYRSTKFELYEKDIKTCPPACMAGLARNLHSGPVTKLYENANIGSQIFPMTEEEMPKFQHTRPDGKVVNLPRIVLELRLYDPNSCTYKTLNRDLTGAPTDRELQWFDDLTKHLKSNLHGAPAADQGMLDFYEKELIESPQFIKQVEQMGENGWIKRFKEVKGELSHKK